MFKTRLLSGIMLMIIALTTVIAGGQVLFTVLFAISLIGMSELYKVFGIEKKAPGIVGYIFAFGYYALIYMEEYLPGEKHTWFMLLFMAYLICQMAVLVFSYPKYNTQQIDHNRYDKLDPGKIHQFTCQLPEHTALCIFDICSPTSDHRF